VFSERHLVALTEQRFYDVNMMITRRAVEVELQLPAYALWVL
jgi:hypothetical protein